MPWMLSLSFFLLHFSLNFMRKPVPKLFLNLLPAVFILQKIHIPDDLNFRALVSQPIRVILILNYFAFLLLSWLLMQALFLFMLKKILIRDSVQDTSRVSPEWLRLVFSCVIISSESTCWVNTERYRVYVIFWAEDFSYFPWTPESAWFIYITFLYDICYVNIQNPSRIISIYLLFSLTSFLYLFCQKKIFDWYKIELFCYPFWQTTKPSNNLAHPINKNAAQELSKWFPTKNT